ncbi:hypothetical protein [Actinotalea solisilvae]|uniref:hypothetical protein n=1 Tax=Actinotalea solisilvae TaxID=2072922 RepID=UPI0018F1862A|nr:hypothetical protein [Actinotalea solisilvae]
MAGRPHDADEPSARPGDGDPPVGATPGPAEPPAGGHGDDQHPGEEHAAGSGEPGPDLAGDADAVAADAPSDAALPAPRASADDGDAGPGTPATGPLSEADVDIDARWRAIVAELGDLGTAPPAGPPRRRATDLPPEPPSALPRAQAPGARTVRPAQPPTPTGPRAWSPDPDVEEAEDHFQPPDPGPVLGGDPLLTMAWIATVGVPVLLLVAVVVWRDMPSVVLRVAGVAFVGAIALLLWRMPHRRDDDAGPGAVV